MGLFMTGILVGILFLYSFFTVMSCIIKQMIIFFMTVTWTLCSLPLAQCQVHRAHRHVCWMTEWLFSSNSPCSHCCPCWDSWRDMPFLFSGGEERSEIYEKLQNISPIFSTLFSALSMDRTILEVMRNHNSALSWDLALCPIFLTVSWVETGKLAGLFIFSECVSLCKGPLI